MAPNFTSFRSRRVADTIKLCKLRPRTSYECKAKRWRTNQSVSLGRCHGNGLNAFTPAALPIVNGPAFCARLMPITFSSVGDPVGRRGRRDGGAERGCSQPTGGPGLSPLGRPASWAEPPSDARSADRSWTNEKVRGTGAAWGYPDRTTRDRSSAVQLDD